LAFERALARYKITDWDPISSFLGINMALIKLRLQIRSDQIRSDQIRSDQIRSDKLCSGATLNEFENPPQRVNFGVS